jgi:hypothetical protein
MNLSVYVDSLRRHLAVAADAGGDAARELADRLTAPLESAVRLVLLDALSAAADEMTRELAPGTVELRIRGGDPELVVIPAPDEAAFDDISPTHSVGDTGLPVVGDGDDGGTARLNLRLPETLKQRIEEAAHREGLSSNAWLLRAAAAALGFDAHTQRRSRRGGDRYTGWVR